MNMQQYLIQSERTAAGTFHTDMVPDTDLINALIIAINALKDLDRIKKALFYRKPLPLDFYMENVLGTVDDGEPLRQQDMFIIHSILGIMTEAGELGEHLVNYIMSEPEDLEGYKPNLVDETGDVLWYQAMLLRLLGTDFETTAGKNLAKLKARFPDKFEERLAIHRDEAAEQSVF